jgi:hypothetical protein
MSRALSGTAACGWLLSFIASPPPKKTKRPEV